MISSSAPARNERTGGIATRRPIASRLLDTIPLPPRYAAHDISESGVAHFSPAGGQEQKEKDLRAISLLPTLRRVSRRLAAELTLFAENRGRETVDG